MRSHPSTWRAPSKASPTHGHARSPRRRLAHFWALLPVALLGGLSFQATSIHANPGPQCTYTGTPPAAVAERRARVRILTQNAFGLDKDGDANCKARGQALGNHIAHASPGYDIVALQEHWESFDAGIIDCDPSFLTDAIWSTGRYRSSNNYYRHRPRGERWQLEADGALSIFTLHPIERFEENEWDDIPRDGPFKTLHGSTFSRIKLNGTDIRLDVYNVHMLAQEADDCSPACRREELEELGAEILSYSRTSGNPVLVMGDFNIGGPPACTGNDSYRDIMQVLRNPRDLWLENHPSENGYTADCLRNSTKSSVEPGCSSRDRIDFLFVVTSPALTNSKYEVVVREPNDIRLAEIRRPDGGGPVSDHFGIEATLEVRERQATGIRELRGLSDKCMDVAGGETADATPVQLFDCNGTVSQGWTLRHDGQLRGLAGKCLTVRRGRTRTANRTLTELRTCTGHARQRFDFTAAGELRSRLDANKCVEVQGGFTANRTPIQLFDCNGTASQKWKQALPIRTDLCRAEVDAVKVAEAAVDNIDAAISALQTELRRASPGEKPFIISEIERLREEELRVTTAALEDARRALQRCRGRTGPFRGSNIPDDLQRQK